MSRLSWVMVGGVITLLTSFHSFAPEVSTAGRLLLTFVLFCCVYFLGAYYCFAWRRCYGNSRLLEVVQTIWIVLPSSLLLLSEAVSHGRVEAPLLFWIPWCMTTFLMMDFDRELHKKIEPLMELVWKNEPAFGENLMKNRRVRLDFWSMDVAYHFAIFAAVSVSLH